MSESPQTKVIAITGGATGIGQATVLKFLAAGYGVSFCDCNEGAVQKLLATPELVAAKEQGRVYFQEVDVKERAAIEAWVAATIDNFGHLDAVFANTGIHRSNTLLNVGDDELQLMINTNIYGTIYTLQETVPYLIKNGGGAVVINDSDQFFIGKSNNFAYGLTKGALGQITRSLAVELGPHHIRVNAVCPSTIHTPLAEQAMERYANRANLTLEQAWDEENHLFLLGRAGEAQEVASMVYYLIAEGTFCTGGHYLVDGGIVAHS